MDCTSHAFSDFLLNFVKFSDDPTFATEQSWLTQYFHTDAPLADGSAYCLSSKYYFTSCYSYLNARYSEEFTSVDECQNRRYGIN